MKKIVKIICVVAFLISFINPPAEAFLGLWEKEPVDPYAKYIGIDENTLSSEEQNRLNEARENLYHKEKTEFHFISRKYPTLKVFNEFANSDNEGWIEYVTENHKKGNKPSKTDDLANTPQNATDKWIEYLGENKGRSHYKTHNLNQTDFWKINIPPTKEDTEEMASYDPYKVVKYYPQIEQTYFDNPVFYNEVKMDNVKAPFPEKHTYWTTFPRSEMNTILANKYPEMVNGNEIKYLDPQSMQEKNVQEKTKKTFDHLFYETSDRDKEAIDRIFQDKINNIEKQRFGFNYFNRYYHSESPDGFHTGKQLPNSYDQPYFDNKSKEHYKVLTEKDIAFIGNVQTNYLKQKTKEGYTLVWKSSDVPNKLSYTHKVIQIDDIKTKYADPKIKEDYIVTWEELNATLQIQQGVLKDSLTQTFSHPQENLINTSASNETISADLLNETAAANESIPANATFVDSETFANLTEAIDTSEQPDEIPEATEEIAEVITEESEPEELAVEPEPEILSEPMDNTPFGVVQQIAFKRSVVEGDWERKIIKNKGTLVFLWENPKRRTAKIRYLTSEMAERLTDYELGIFSDPTHIREGDIVTITHKESDEGIDAYRQEKYFSEEGKRLYKNIAVSHNYNIETGKVEQIFIQISNKNAVEIDFEKKEIYLPSHN